MKISLIQLGIEWEDPDKNKKTAAGLIRKAAKEGADLVCLPELFSTGVTLDSIKFAEKERGETCGFLSQLAELHGIYLVGSFIEVNGRKHPYNASITYGPEGGRISKSRKIHLFTHGGEDKGYSFGKPTVTIFNAGGFTICPIICYDLRFPAIFQAALGKGANLFIVQANWPTGRRTHWETLLAARAIECQSYVAGVNQVGKSPRNEFFGGSKMIDPMGEIISEASDRQEVITVSISSDSVGDYRGKYPFQNERRDIRP
jgi:omega-amidase